MFIYLPITLCHSSNPLPIRNCLVIENVVNMKAEGLCYGQVGLTANVKLHFS